MKKVFMVIALCLMCAASLTSCDTVKVKNGKGEIVKIHVDNHIVSNYFVNNKACWYKDEINSTVTELKFKCKYPPTFTPTGIRLSKSKGEYAEYVDVEVFGYAKTGFGVEDNVSHFKSFRVKNTH